ARRRRTPPGGARAVTRLGPRGRFPAAEVPTRPPARPRATPLPLRTPAPRTVGASPLALCFCIPSASHGPTEPDAHIPPPARLRLRAARGARARPRQQASAGSERALRRRRVRIPVVHGQPPRPHPPF